MSVSWKINNCLPRRASVTAERTRCFARCFRNSGTPRICARSTSKPNARCRISSDARPSRLPNRVKRPRKRCGRCGGPLFDFRGELNTRFIGDLYQDLDPDVQKRYALLQTPHFIEAFILDRTLEPALADFGLRDFRIIDPTCGSGHFLLGAFERIFRAWSAELGGGNAVRWEAASRALDAVYGADLNEYACALSRFRLLLGVVAATGERDLARLRTLPIHVLTCDSLIPWERISREMLPGTADASWLSRYGSAEERDRNEAF